MLQLLIKSLSPAIAIILGVYSFRFMNTFFKLLFWQVLMYMFFFTMSYVVTNYQTAHHLNENNQWLFNIYLIIETVLLCIALFNYLNYQSKMPLYGMLSVLVTFYAVQTMLNGIYHYNKYSDIAACIALSAVSARILFNQFQYSKQLAQARPAIWAIVGLLLYFACSVPYIAMMDFLELHHPKLNTFLFRIINGFLANIRYLCLAIAFYLIRFNALKSPLNANTKP